MNKENLLLFGFCVLMVAGIMTAGFAVGQRFAEPKTKCIVLLPTTATLSTSLYMLPAGCDEVIYGVGR